jgi:hypothetical protein
LSKGQWAVFSTDDSNSEIGLFDEDGCTYDVVVNDSCLNFSKDYLITGQSRTNFDCTKQIYWADSLNPDRTIAIDADDPSNNPYTSPNSPIPWIQDCTDSNGNDPGGCIECENTSELDCDKIRLAPLVDNLCFEVKTGPTSGELTNGSYYVVGAYAVNGQVVTDYSLPSNVQSVWSHEDISSSLEITVDASNDIFDEFELVLVAFIKQQTFVKRVGMYSVNQTLISIDSIIDTWADVDIRKVLQRTPIVEKSDAIFKNGPYLIRSGPTDKFDFNYQPLANQIVSKWVSVKYPDDYYRKGGTNVGYLRDEVYAFFIRWVYNTGDTSASYHIPGRYAAPNSSVFDDLTGNADAQVDVVDGITPFTWRVYNTAPIPNPGFVSYFLPDGGEVIQEGEMAYWESSEFYDDNQPEIWNASAHPWSATGNAAHDLCGTPIRHHKFPENATDPLGTTNHFGPNGNTIHIMSVKFENVQPPLDSDGNPIPGIVGYEILRGSREGNKTIFAKGLINNMREYDIPDDISTRQGLYPNYPYNYLGPDKFLNAQPTQNDSFSGNAPSIKPHDPYTGYRKDVFTFHSPETNFRNPYLNAKEIKVYGELNGLVEGNFQFPDKHPKHKFINNRSFVLSALLGLTYTLQKLTGGNRRISYNPVQSNNIGLKGTFGASSGDVSAASVLYSAFAAGYATSARAGRINQNAKNVYYDIPLALLGDATGLGQALAGSDYYNTVFNRWNKAMHRNFPLPNAPVYGAATRPGNTGGGIYLEQDMPEWRSLPQGLRQLANLSQFLSDWSAGVNDFLELIKAWIPYKQYALQYISHGFYDNYVSSSGGNIRRGISNQAYIDPTLSAFAGYRVNNIFRSRTVGVELEGILQDPTVTDNTQQTFSDVATPSFFPPGLNIPFLDGPQWSNDDEDKVSKSFTTQASSHYVALKQRLSNQYGQLRGIVQVPVTTCAIPEKLDSTNPLFNGDTYIGRYTEKNTMFFFYEWLYNLPDGTEFDYRFYKMLPHPKFWADTDPFDFYEFVNSLGQAIGSLTPTAFNNIVVPTKKFAFDRKTPVANALSAIAGGFYIKDAFFYLFNSGVKDFFVESEINIDYRDWEELPYQRHYDRQYYTDLREMFKPPNIKFGNFYKYDYSLSVSKLFNNYLPWGQLQEPSYDPTIAETCFVYRPKRVIYSLPQDQENRKDYWRVFLTANYKDFVSKVTSIHPISKNGALLMFETESPVMFEGVDKLVTDSDTKITLGDGGLFSQPLQNLVNADKPNEYGSCQNLRCVVNTPLGLFYLSQNQGKVFQIGKSLQEISNANNKWWFANYLPYKLLEDFPDFELVDNPVVGIGCQTVFDNTDQVVFFCKKDYALRKDILDQVEYAPARGPRRFLVNGVLEIDLGDPAYFEDASWTMSYDPKTKVWISHHDWHPDLVMASKNTFLTTKDNGIWVHNDVCDSFCNFYGVDYPFEIELAASAKTTVNTLRSIEYYMEVYKYEDNCYDRFHDLDFNFDEAIVFNTEQCSGLLKLNLKPKNNAPEILNYPQVNINNIDILYSKEEQKYRFNQFWDITDDRGEFNAAAERVIFNTEPNGYIRNLNPNNLNYDKFELERKKFRHYITNILLRRRVSGNRNMTVVVLINKNLLSPR